MRNQREREKKNRDVMDSVVVVGRIQLRGMITSLAGRPLSVYISRRYMYMYRNESKEKEILGKKYIYRRKKIH